MPSLIYVTQIGPLSAEQARALEASGLHVKSFGPGEITADECTLVMTSEAALAGLQVSGPVPVGEDARRAELKRASPLGDIQKHLGVEAAVWQRIKAAGVSEPAPGKSTGSKEQVSSRPSAISEASNLGLNGGQGGARAVISGEKSAKIGAASVPQFLPPQKATLGNGEFNKSRPLISSARTAVSSTARVPALRSQPVGSPLKAGLEDSRRLSRFWKPAALATTLLILAAVLLASRAPMLPSATDVAAASDGKVSESSDSKDAVLVQNSSSVRSQPFDRSNRTASSNKSANLAADRRRLSRDEFVAEDYTTHYGLQSHPTVKPPTLRHGEQSRLIRKRVVAN